MAVRIKERRNQDLVSMIKYIHTLNLESTSELPSSSKAAIIRYTKENEIIKRLFDEEVNCVEIEEAQCVDSDSESDESQELVPVRNLNERLVDAISAALKTKPIKTKSINKKNIQKELQFYESTGNKTKNLDKLLEALMTIQPTSIESERTFSTSSNFCTKKRSSMSDSTINALSFLKSYFGNKDF